MPEMPGLASQPVYEVKGTRLSPSSGAYEAPVTGTHWANDGFERRVRARCAAPQVLLTCHRCSTQPKSIRMCEGNRRRRRAAKEGTDGGRDGGEGGNLPLLDLAFALLKGGWLVIRPVVTWQGYPSHMFLRPITK